MGNSRAVAAADLNQDGLLDLVVTNYLKHPQIFINITAPKGDWIKVALQGSSHNIQGVGADIFLYEKNGKVQMRKVSIGQGYLSQEPSVVHFGIRKGSSLDKIKVIWPNGKVQTLKEGLKLNQLITIKESL